MVVESSPMPSLSWKDILVGKDTFVQNNTNDGHFFVDNFSLTEQGVKKSFVDDVPSIDFSERVYPLLENEMSTSVVLKMLGWNLGITSLHNRLYGIWRPFKPFQLMDKRMVIFSLNSKALMTIIRFSPRVRGLYSAIT
ncbi:hypothetical protein J1N35_026779 [Gossypium stocksii]|uniref:DUF4283 domain-containing protein n=1 Tax=Gossypium stocksii TaxID=47602 RepID=A0A9D3VAC5_9ROSI|nr:hypothetical protein J1N35_026779 [Gossypium stocksii]